LWTGAVKQGQPATAVNSGYYQGEPASGEKEDAPEAKMEIPEKSIPMVQRVQKNRSKNTKTGEEGRLT
jgi:hypothetical protein